MDLPEIAKKQLEATVAVQAELLDQVQTMSQAWFVRAQSELDLISEITTKFASVRSFPEATAVGQEWMSKRMSMVIEDGRRSAADCQKLAQTGARLFTHGRGNGGA